MPALLIIKGIRRYYDVKTAEMKSLDFYCFIVLALVTGSEEAGQRCGEYDCDAGVNCYGCFASSCMFGGNEACEELGQACYDYNCGGCNYRCK